MSPYSGLVPSPNPPSALTAAVAAWYLEERRDLPWRADDATPWGVLVSEFMLQQTQVDRVLPRWHEWMRAWPRPCDLAAAGPGEAIRAWGRLGYPRRAAWLHAAAVRICTEHGGRVPDRLEDLLALKGVGAYTARAVLVFAFHQRHPVVDTNVRRVIARAVGGHGEPGPPRPAADHAATEAILPRSAERVRTASYALMELGALVCTARSPRCDVCPVQHMCAWVAAGRPGHTGPRPRRQARFAGSDRQERGRIMALLRAAAAPLDAQELLRDAPSSEQGERALASLVADGLAQAHPSGYTLP